MDDTESINQADPDEQEAIPTPVKAIRAKNPPDRYKCQRCGKYFRLSSEFTVHLMKKIPCGTLGSVYIYNCNSEKLMRASSKYNVQRLYDVLCTIYDNMTDNEREEVRKAHEEIVIPYVENYLGYS